MLYSISLTLGITGLLFLLSGLVRRLLHCVLIHRTGVAVPVLVGDPADEALPARVFAALAQSSCSNLECCREVIVLDCGVSGEIKDCCRAAVQSRGVVLFLPQAELCEYLVATRQKKEYNQKERKAED